MPPPPVSPGRAAPEGSSEPPTPTPGAPPGDNATEGVLLRRAQDALANDPAQALALADEHATRFHGGALAQEREIIAISALVRLGRAADARARAERFVAQFPTSAHRRRMEVLVPDLKSNEDFGKDPGAAPSTP